MPVLRRRPRSARRGAGGKGRLGLRRPCPCEGAISEREAEARKRAALAAKEEAARREKALARAGILRPTRSSRRCGRAPQWRPRRPDSSPSGRASPPRPRPSSRAAWPAMTSPACSSGPRAARPAATWRATSRRSASRPPSRGRRRRRARRLQPRHEVDPADALGALPGLVDDLVALALEEGLDRAHRLFLHVVHVLLLRLLRPALWRALRRVSRMQRGRAVKGGSEVGRGYRNLPTSVFRVVRARSAWGEEPEKVSRPLQAACRRATLRVQGEPGRVSDRRGAGVRHGIGRGRRGFRAWDAARRRLLGSRGDWRRRRGGDNGAFPSRGAAVRIGTAFPAPLAADMRTGSPAARWFSMRNGYGAARHVC